MRTVLCSDRRGGEWCLPGVSAQVHRAGGVSAQVHPPVDRILDTRLWKHYLSATSFADGNNDNFILAVPLEVNLTNEILNLEV